MNDYLKDPSHVTLKRIPLAEKGAAWDFITMAGRASADVRVHAGLLKAMGAQPLPVIGPEVYGSYPLSGAVFDGLGQTDFIGTGQGDSFYSGLQACILHGVSSQPVMDGGRRTGIVFEDVHARYVLLGGLLPRDLSADEAAQTRDVFEQMESSLKTVGMDFSHVARTWFYNNEILKWYDVFNRARDAFFVERGVFDRLVPASTGVGSRNRLGAALLARVFAVQPKSEKVRVYAVDSPLQCPAPDYRSSFSRAVEVSHPNFRHLMVSGTASIAPGGETVHLDDIEKQIALSLDVVEAILTARTMTWSDTVRAVIYLKDIAHVPHFVEAQRRRGLEQLPCVVIQSDVCRDNLLFEIELDAVSVVRS